MVQRGLGLTSTSFHKTCLETLALQTTSRLETHISCLVIPTIVCREDKLYSRWLKICNPALLIQIFSSTMTRAEEKNTIEIFEQK